MKHAVILIIGILATFLFAETGKHKITKVYGTGIAFNEHYIVTTGEPVTVTGFLQENSKLQIKSFPAKVVADSTFPEYVARALNVRTPGGFSGAAISSYGKVIGMSFGNSTRKSDISFFYDGMLLSEYIRSQNRPTTADISKCTYQVRSYVTVE